jgi:hypothetical protein
LILELRGTMTFVREAEDKLHSKLQNEVDSLKMMMKVVDESRDTMIVVCTFVLLGIY